MLRHRVITSRVKRMAAEYPFQSHPATLEEAIFLDSFIGILRAGRGEAARGRSNL